MKSLKLISLALSMLVCFVSLAQEKTITGTVTDQANLPLPGVSILIKKSKKTAQTDYEGKYSIQAQTGDVLIFSYIGMKSQNITVKKSNVINVIMADDNKQLEEVMVVGYGTSNAEYEDNGYSRDKRKMANKSVAQMVQGRVAGLAIQNSTQYLANPTVTTVRESVPIPSAPSKNEPMYIVDGVTIKADQMAKINPNDIQDMKILKDVTSTSVYGSKGANGVIVIATKGDMYKNLSEKELDAKLNHIYISQQNQTTKIMMLL